MLLQHWGKGEYINFLIWKLIFSSDFKRNKNLFVCFYIIMDPRHLSLMPAGEVGITDRMRGREQELFSEVGERAYSSNIQIK